MRKRDKKIPNVQDNLGMLAKLESIVGSHLVGGKLDHSVPGKLRYIFFEKWSGLDGIQVSLADGKINAYEWLIRKLDVLYNVENAWMSCHKAINSLEGLHELAL